MRKEEGEIWKGLEGRKGWENDNYELKKISN